MEDGCGMERCCGQATMVRWGHWNSWRVRLWIPLFDILSNLFCVQIPCMADPLWHQCLMTARGYNDTNSSFKAAAGIFLTTNSPSLETSIMRGSVKRVDGWAVDDEVGKAGLVPYVVTTLEGFIHLYFWTLTTAAWMAAVVNANTWIWSRRLEMAHILGVAAHGIDAVTWCWVHHNFTTMAYWIIIITQRITPGN